MKIEKDSWIVDNITVDKYLKVCKDASENVEVFNTFKQHPDYGAILEHCTYDLGNSYRSVIRDNYPSLLRDINIFTNNDILGGTIGYDYSGTIISPSTLMYVKILGDLMELFGTLNNMSIAEIGCGYGGQCLTIANKFTFKHYTLFDLPEPCLLIDKYLSRHGLVNFSFGSLNQKKKYDLVISNYAFSECNREIQDAYIDKVIKHSSKGYMIINAFVDEVPRKNEEIISLIKEIHPSLRAYPDILSVHGNYILTWSE